MTLTKNGGVYTIFDTGSSQIQFSALWFPSFIEQFFASAGVKEYEMVDNRTHAPCNGKYRDLYILTDGLWLQVARDDYMMKIGDGMCVFHFT